MFRHKWNDILNGVIIVVSLAMCKVGRKGDMEVTGLQVFYLTVAIMGLAVAVILWTDAIRAKKEKKR